MNVKSIRRNRSILTQMERLWPLSTVSRHSQAAILLHDNATRLALEAAKNLAERRFLIEVFRIGTSAELPKGIPGAHWSRIVLVANKSNAAKLSRSLNQMSHLPVVSLDPVRLTSERIMEACLRNLE